MFDCDNDQSISYQDFIMYLATSGTHYAKTTNMMFNIGEKEKHRKLMKWDQVDMQSRNTFCIILERSLKIAKRLTSIKLDFPVEMCKLKQNMQELIDKEEASKRVYVNNLSVSGWAGTRVGMYEFDQIRRAFWREGIRIGSLGGVEEYALRILLR